MEGLAVERMGGAGAVAVQEALRGVYAEAFAGAPYCVTEDEATASFRRFPSQAGRAGFPAVLGRDAGGEPVGMAYGCLLEAGSAWLGRDERGCVPGGRAAQFSADGACRKGAVAWARCRAAAA